MKKTVYIIGGIALAAGAVFGIYKYMEAQKRKKALKVTPTKLTIDKVDWDKKVVYATFYLDGKKWESPIINWVNKPDRFNVVRPYWNKPDEIILEHPMKNVKVLPYNIYIVNQPNGIELQAKYQGEATDKKHIIDFSKKTIS